MTLTHPEGPWGPLAQPVSTRQDVPDIDSIGKPWRDNAFFGFWDVDREIFGIIHFSTSPNSGGCRARASFSARGRSYEVIEPLDTGTFQSSSISVDLQDTLAVKHDHLQAELTLRPRSGPIDFAKGQPLPPLGEHLPLQHWEQSYNATGSVTIGSGISAEHHRFDGRGLRDRTFGWRDESAQWVEYTWIVATFDDFDISMGKMRGADGTERVSGWKIVGDEQERITGFTVLRDASGMYRGGTAELASSAPVTITESRRRAGFWLPMGADDQTGPVFSAFDELVELRTETGQAGFGIAEHGILRHVS